MGNYTNAGSSYQLQNIALNKQGDLYYQQNTLQQVSYNAFKSPVEITEAGKDKVSFQYNAFMGRANMFYGGTQTDKLERRYRKHYAHDGSMEITRDTQSGKTTFIIYIGGNAYNAPAIWHSEQGSTTTQEYLYLSRDYLGSIMAIMDKNGSIKEKRHFDAWGNIVKLTDGNNNNLNNFVYLDRGYTGHEHLLGVGLVHMNGRLYDPQLHRFLSPDNYVQDPFNTQNFNRYGYVLNNPLKYTDESGEFWHIVAGAAIGGVVNWAMNGCQFNAKGLGYFTAGAAGGALAAAFGPAGWAASGALIGGSNAALSRGGMSQIAQGAFVGAMSGLAGGYAGQWASQGLGGLVINGLNVTSPIAKGIIGGAIGGGAGGYAGGFTGGLLMTGNLSAANSAGIDGLKFGAALGAGTGALSAYSQARKNDVDPFSGRPNNSVTIGEGMTSNPEKGWFGIDKISKDLGSGQFTPENLPKESWYTDGALMQENANWLESKMEMNSVIYDRGSVGNNSQYYNMEIGRTMNYQNLYNIRSYYNQNQTIRVHIIYK